MAPGGEMFRYPQHFGENVLRHGSHEWLPYSKDEVRLKSSNNNLPLPRETIPCLPHTFFSEGSSQKRSMGYNGY